MLHSDKVFSDSIFLMNLLIGELFVMNLIVTAGKMSSMRAMLTLWLKGLFLSVKKFVLTIYH